VAESYTITNEGILSLELTVTRATCDSWSVSDAPQSYSATCMAWICEVTLCKACKSTLWQDMCWSQKECMIPC